MNKKAIDEIKNNIFELESDLKALEKAVEILEKRSMYGLYINMDSTIKELQSEVNKIKANAYDTIRTHWEIEI